MITDRRQFVAASAAGAVGVLGQQLSFAQAPELFRSVHHKVGHIDWYCETQGRGPTVVLIPSGEGDCGSFAKVAALLASRFQVLTFDMPGFSRSSDPPGFDRYTISQAAGEIAALTRSLELGPATFYGCSSGGQIALRLAAEHPDLVRRAIVHEVAPSAERLRDGGPVAASQPPSDPTPGPGGLTPSSSDEQIIAVCKGLFRNQMNENPQAWDALGADYHQRLQRNYVTWVRRYFPIPDMRTPTPDELRRRPVTWTIGGLTRAAAFHWNVVAGHAAGIEVGLLMCMHFPQVSIPEALATHIARA